MITTLLNNVTEFIQKVYSNVISYLDGFGKDKYQHFTLGVILSAVSLVVAGLFTQIGWAPLISAIVVAIIAVLKEWFDGVFGGIVDKWDFLATIIGGCSISLLAWIILLL